MATAKLALLFVVATLGGCSSCGKSKQEEAQQRAAKEAMLRVEAQKMMQKASQDRSSAPRIHIPDVITEINADPTAATTKYDGQLVKVTGTVAEKSPVSVIIHDDDGAATCALPPAQLGRVNVGDKVDVTGYFQKGSGHVAVRLDSCELLEKDASP